MNGRGLIIGAARSGAGKTSVTIGLLRAFKRRGLAINGAKSGPDYIDPGFHSAASGQRGVNLDSWAMAPDLLAGLLAHAVSGQDLLLIAPAWARFRQQKSMMGHANRQPIRLLQGCQGLPLKPFHRRRWPTSQPPPGLSPASRRASMRR